MSYFKYLSLYVKGVNKFPNNAFNSFNKQLWSYVERDHYQIPCFIGKQTITSTLPEICLVVLPCTIRGQNLKSSAFLILLISSFEVQQLNSIIF